MHGLIMNQLRQYVVQRLGRDGWHALVDAAGTARTTYQIGQVYPDQEMTALVAAASTASGQSDEEVLEDFGHYLVPGLYRIYQPALPASWRTLDVIEHAEDRMHLTVRMRDHDADPPHLTCERVAPDEVRVDYQSPRRLCALARGIARGLADYHHERITITQPECQHRGDARCLLIFRC